MTELAYFAIGLIVGSMNAVAGGGMLLGFPALVALGVPPLTANITGHVITVPGQLGSVYGYRKYLSKVPRRFWWLVVPLVIGSVLGALTLRNTSAEDFADIVPWLVMFGVALFAFQPFLHFHVRQHIHGKHRSVLAPFLLISFALLPLSFYGGYFGAGFGFMMLAFLSFAKLSDLHTMNALKNIAAVVVSIAAVIALLPTGGIDWTVGLTTGAGTLVGGYAGARGSTHVDSHWLRIFVIITGFAAAIYLALQRY